MIVICVQLAALEGALAYHPHYADAHFHLARTLDESGRAEEAEIHWARFLEIAPDSPWADQARGRIEQPAVAVRRTGQADREVLGQRLSSAVVGRRAVHRMVPPPQVGNRVGQLTVDRSQLTEGPESS